MINDNIHNFKTVAELQRSLDERITAFKQKSEELSSHIGEKMRTNDSTNATELQELRQKIEGSTTDPKKKKSTKRKDQKSNWYNFESISIYDGVGIKGELELYFKALEKIKTELERVTKIKQTVDELVNKGLKREMGCVLYLNGEVPAEIAFTTSIVSRKKFSFRAIFNVQRENTYEIKI